MVLTAHPGEAMASPETLEALEECRARIELLSHVNETSLRKLSKKQLVGVVGDLLAMAARQEFERARRFETATSSASVRRAKEKAEREAALRRERERAEQAERAAIRERRVAAAVTIQKRVRGNAVRAKSAHRREALASYEKDLREAEARAAEAVRREAASTTIQSAFRARVARREAKSRWLQAWASRRRASSRRAAPTKRRKKKNAPRKRKRRESVSVRVLRGRSGGVCGLAERDAAAARTGAVPPGRLRERRGVRRRARRLF